MSIQDWFGPAAADAFSRTRARSEAQLMGDLLGRLEGRVRRAGEAFAVSTGRLRLEVRYREFVEELRAQAIREAEGL